MLITIYNYHIDQILPEILPSISETLMEMPVNIELTIRNNSDIMKIMTAIISTAFLQHNEEIKRNIEYTDAFENILNKLISWEVPTAAVVLDEFRLH